VLGGDLGSEPSEYRSRSNLSESFISGENSVDCTSCHDPHRPGGQSLLVEEVQAVCTSCHSPAGYLKAGHSSVPCSGCHQLHGISDRGMLRSGIDVDLCGACHSIGLTEFIESPLLRASIVPGPVGHPEPPEEPCRSCHLAH
jgi:predicted CXXCH cytochrome family protein